MEEQKGATQERTTTMIDTSGTPAKKTPMLKLGKRRFGAPRQEADAEEESKGSARDEGLTCPFRACGRRFVAEAELKNHMQRRHRPAATPTESSAAETEASSTKQVEEVSQGTPIPSKSKVSGTRMLEVQTRPSPQKGFKVAEKHEVNGFSAKPKVVNARPATAGAIK